MHYWKNGQWAESQPVFEIFPDGIVARQCRHQVVLALNLNTVGSVDLQCDGQRFRSHVFGLAYTDAASGNNVMIAQIKDSAAELIAPNQVLYRDAFQGDVKGDVLYTLTREGLSQWILLRENPPPPEDYQMASRSARMEVWTEWVEAPVPSKRTQVLRSESDPALRLAMADPDLRDEELAFGALFMGPGAAFPLENDKPELGYEQEIPVGKLWIRAVDPNGGPERRFLIEQADYQSIQPRLRRLPQAAAVQRGNKNAQMAAAPPPSFRVPGPSNEKGLNGVIEEARIKVKGEPRVVARVFPPSPGRATNAPHILLARSLSGLSTTNAQLAFHAAPKPFNLGNAFVLDWTLMNAGSLTNYVFAGDSTTFINGVVNLYGTTTLEGGAVLKGTNGQTGRLVIQGALDCRTTAFRPAFCVGKDDDTIGEIIAGSTGNPNSHGNALTNYYGKYLDFTGNTNVIDLHDVRIRNAYYGISLNNAPQLTVRNAQISGSYAAFVYGNASVQMRNILICDGTYFIGTSGTVIAEHATLHRVSFLRSAPYTNAFFTNSLIICVTNNLRFTGGSDAVTNVDDTGIFQAVGSGTHYLAANSPYRNVGTTNINAALLNDLKQRTTYPPILLSNTIASDTILTPQAQRDTDGPDLGYEYDPVDWLAGGVSLTNASLTLSGGAILGTYGVTGIELCNNSVFLSPASADAFNVITRYNMVQEDTGTNWCGGTPSYQTLGSISEQPCTVRLRFTRFTLPGGSGSHFISSGDGGNVFTAEHCELYNGEFDWQIGSLVSFTNCLLHRLNSQIRDADAPLTGHWRNNSFYRGRTHWLIPVGTVDIIDNLFDYTTNTQGAPVTHNYNAYLTNATRLTNFGGNDIVLAATNYSYQTNDWWEFYLPTNSLLLNAGSTYATNVGLYHFTTTQNQWKETNSVVDIGVHRVAVNGYGQPVDTDNDGWPDYWEDANGNGSLDSGETKPSDAADRGLRVFITRPRSGSTIP